MTTHLYIPDAQVKKDVPLDHLKALGNWIVANQPEVIVNAGDFADMPSLSQYDYGKRSFEGRRYRLDIDAAHEGMEMLLTPMWEYNRMRAKNGKKQYRPRMVLTYGNHEDRINRVVNSDARLDGTIGLEDLCYREYGWETVPYMEGIVIDGVAYSHFFYNKLSGRPHPNARTTLLREHMSCVQGHQQKLEIDTQYRGDGKRMTAITAGAFYLHDEDYKGSFGNDHWRGVVVLKDVKDGDFDFEVISIERLIREWL